jgi:ubiquinone/menaquinone biosynthesis C-methylase UbiE
MVKDSREVTYDAKEHTDLVITILAESKLKPHNIFRHADFSGKKVVDIGCGDGAMCKESVKRGADYVLGIDGKSEMINIAIKTNQKYDNIKFKESFIEDILGDESFDIAILSYLLNNAKNYDQLLQQCKSAASFLKPSGIAIIYNSNPFDIIGGNFTKYGFKKIVTGTNDGDKIIFDYRPAITEDIINYYISPKTHEQAFADAGFSKFQWKPVELYHNANNKFWKDYFNRKNLPVITAVLKK